MDVVKRAIEALIFLSRWLVAPFLIGLIVAVAALLGSFCLKLYDFVIKVRTAVPAEMMLGILNLVDLTLIANLIVIVICSSYDNFLAPIDAAKHPGWPEGLVKIGFSGLKQKLLGSIVAISAVNVLEWFMDIDQHVDAQKLAWVVGILIALAATMLIVAIADRVSSSANGNH
jgi:uncharacterized protein (TIGR00645 family)